MKCKKCGELIDGFAFKCPVCGAPMTKDDNDLRPVSSVNPAHTHWEDCSSDTHPGLDDGFTDPDQDRYRSRTLGPVEAIRLFFVRFSDFRGRSRRSEYWWATLFVYVLEMALTSIAPELGSIVTLVLVVPCLSLCIRRFHDIGKSGWWCLLNLIPFFGSVIVLIMFCMDSKPDNRWGKSPKF